MEEEIDRFTTSLGSLIDKQATQIRDRVTSLSSALERFADRMSAIIDATASAVPASGGAAPAPTGGLQLVRVMNAADSPVPVRVIGEGGGGGGRGRGGLFGTILGGIGSFFGNLVGGIFGGFAAPFAAIAIGAELVAAVAAIIPVVILARRLVADVREFAVVLVRGIRSIINQLFRELEGAGILPVSKLIASLLIFLDVGITLVLAHLKPVLDWVASLVEALANWLGQFISRLSSWLQGALNALPAFLSQLVTFIYETALKPAIADLLQTVIRPAVHEIVRDAIRSAVEAFVAVLSGFLIALGRTIIEVGTWLGEWIAYSIASVLNEIPGIDLDVSRPRDLGSRVSQGLTESFLQGREFGTTVAEGLLGPAPTGGGAGAGTGTPTPGAGGTVAPPRIRLPGFRAPELELPEFPTPRPALEGILTAPERERVSTTPTEAGAAPAPTPEAAQGVNVTGGINVAISAQTVDLDNAEETARVIATHVMEELNRLTERARFRQGLPTSTIA